MASSQQQVELLLQETAEAQEANLALKGIHDLRGLLAAVGRDRVLQPVHLDGVASSLGVRCMASFYQPCMLLVAHHILFAVTLIHIFSPFIALLCSTWFLYATS